MKGPINQQTGAVLILLSSGNLREKDVACVQRFAGWVHLSTKGTLCSLSLFAFLTSGSYLLLLLSEEGQK